VHRQTQSLPDWSKALDSSAFGSWPSATELMLAFAVSGKTIRSIWKRDTMLHCVILLLEAP
jgi:hypothetical protein